jgi:hypothetical protein
VKNNILATGNIRRCVVKYVTGTKTHTHVRVTMITNFKLTTPVVSKSTHVTSQTMVVVLKYATKTERNQTVLVTRPKITL